MKIKISIEVDSKYIDKFLNLIYNFNNINNQGEPENKVKILSKEKILAKRNKKKE